jgi:hypothetical protein
MRFAKRNSGFSCLPFFGVIQTAGRKKKERKLEAINK